MGLKYDNYESRQFNRFREPRVQPHNHADTFVMDSHTFHRSTELHKKLHQISLCDRVALYYLTARSLFGGGEFMQLQGPLGSATAVSEIPAPYHTSFEILVGT